MVGVPAVLVCCGGEQRCRYQRYPERSLRGYRAQLT